MPHIFLALDQFYQLLLVELIKLRYLQQNGESDTDFMLL